MNKFNLRSPKFRTRFKEGQLVRNEFGLHYRVERAVLIGRGREFVIISNIHTWKYDRRRDFSFKSVSSKNLTLVRGVGK